MVNVFSQFYSKNINILFYRTILSFVIFNSIECLVERSNSYSMGVYKSFFPQIVSLGRLWFLPLNVRLRVVLRYPAPWIQNILVVLRIILQLGHNYWLGWEQFCHCIKKKFFHGKETSFLRFVRIYFVNAFRDARTDTDLKQGFIWSMGS